MFVAPGRRRRARAQPNLVQQHSFIVEEASFISNGRRYACSDSQMALHCATRSANEMRIAVPTEISLGAVPAVPHPELSKYILSRFSHYHAMVNNPLNVSHRILFRFITKISPIFVIIFFFAIITSPIVTSIIKVAALATARCLIAMMLGRNITGKRRQFSHLILKSNVLLRGKVRVIYL